MKLLYLCMWGVEDGLTESTVFPHLEILARMENISKIYFVTHERESKQANYKGPSHHKIKFIPNYSKQLTPKILNQVWDFIYLPKFIAAFCEQNHVDAILSRGAPAGAIAWMAHTKCKIPFYVESYEPHAQYMLESKVWHKWSLQYLFQNYWEKKQKQQATFLMPVAENYRKQLMAEGVPAEKIAIIPCCVNLENFKYRAEYRSQIRTELQIASNDITGIYVGKFGGIYYYKEAFQLFKEAFNYWPDRFRLIILTPQNEKEIRDEIELAGINNEKVFIKKAPHADIPKYLSAADFAYSLARSSNSKQYLSPIKDGEYWANGLPIMIGDKIGDDSDIINNTPQQGTGVVFSIDGNPIRNYYQKMDSIISGRTREQAYNDLQKIAAQYRNFSIAQKVYEQLFSKPL